MAIVFHAIETHIQIPQDPSHAFHVPKVVLQVLEQPFVPLVQLDRMSTRMGTVSTVNKTLFRLHQVLLLVSHVIEVPLPLLDLLNALLVQQENSLISLVIASIVEQTRSALSLALQNVEIAILEVLQHLDPFNALSAMLESLSTNGEIVPIVLRIHSVQVQE